MLCKHVGQYEYLFFGPMSLLWSVRCVVSFFFKSKVFGEERGVHRGEPAAAVGGQDDDLGHQLHPQRPQQPLQSGSGWLADSLVGWFDWLVDLIGWLVGWVVGTVGVFCCLSVCLSVCLPVCLSACLVCLPVLSVCLSCLSACLVCPPVLSASLSCLSVCLVCLPVLSARLSCLSACLFHVWLQIRACASFMLSNCVGLVYSEVRTYRISLTCCCLAVPGTV